MQRRWKTIAALLALVVVIAVVLAVARAGDGGDDADQTTTTAPPDVPVEDLPTAQVVVEELRADPCRLADPRKLSEALQLDEGGAGVGTEGSCVVEIGPVTVRVEVGGPVAAARFGVGLSGREDLATEPDHIAFAPSGPGGPVVAVLRGGVEARATLISEEPIADLEAKAGRIGSLLTRAIPPNQPVAEVPGAGAADGCTLLEGVDLPALGLGMPQLSPAGPECTLIFPDQQLTVGVAQASSAADATALDGLARSSAGADGELLEWPVERLAAPGDAAAWLVDPTVVDRTAGELYVLSGTDLYLFTVSLAPKDDATARDLTGRLALVVVTAAG